MTVPIIKVLLAKHICLDDSCLDEILIDTDRRNKCYINEKSPTIVLCCRKTTSDHLFNTFVNELLMIYITSYVISMKDSAIFNFILLKNILWYKNILVRNLFNQFFFNFSLTMSRM